MYYLIEISKGDSKIAGKAVYEYGTSREAIAAFHSKMGTAMKSDLFTSELVIVVDGNGTVLKRECWVDPVETAEEE